MKYTVAGPEYDYKDLPTLKKMLYDLLIEKAHKTPTREMAETELELIGVLCADEDVKFANDLEEANEEVTPV